MRKQQKSLKKHLENSCKNKFLNQLSSSCSSENLMPGKNLLISQHCFSLLFSGNVIEDCRN